MEVSRFEQFLRSPIGNALGHIFEGAILLCVVALATRSPMVGWLVQSFYFLGRERRDHENDAGLNPFMDWYKGWNVFRWSPDGRRDLFSPVLANGALAILMAQIL